MFEPPALFLFLVLSNRQREHSYLFLWHHLHNGSWHGCFWTWVIETRKTNLFLKRVNSKYLGLFLSNEAQCETGSLRLGLAVSHSNASRAASGVCCISTSSYYVSLSPSDDRTKALCCGMHCTGVSKQKHTEGTEAFISNSDNSPFRTK